jgi:phosphohistidine phosphatase
MPAPSRLFLLRHTKSSWDDPGLADHDRPLAPRGRRAAKRMGRYLHDEGIAPELVLCSSARRARETLELVCPPGRIQLEPELYGASADELVGRLRLVPDDVRSVMLIGHNPAMQDLALLLAGGGAELARVERKFATGAVATLTLDGGWHALRPGCAELTGFVRPKDLG